MLRIVLLVCLINLIINAGNANALDEGSFLWAQRSPDIAYNSRNDKASVAKPARWTRSVFNWLHSPLINSISEAIVPDSIYDNSPPPSNYIKRSLSKDTSSRNLEESFENEFFLWEDDEGNPLEFGLKQIQDVRPCNHTIQDRWRFNRARTDHLWEEPLIFEYNQDVKDIDIEHLSFHEKFKLNDILKNKLHNAFQHHRFTFKHTTKHPSIYYTLHPSENISSTANCSNGLCSTKSSSKQPYRKSVYKTSERSTDRIANEQNTSVEIIRDAFKTQSSCYVFSSDIEGNNFTGITAPTISNPLNPSSTNNEHFIPKSPQDVLVPLKPWLDSHEARLGGEETSLFNYNSNEHNTPKKSYVAQRNVSNESPNRRKLRTIHHKRFLKYRRKNKRRNNKTKYPEDRSYQFELFNGNLKPSIK